MTTADWENTKQEKRILYIKKFSKSIPYVCPECNHELTNDNEQLYCTHCGLVCMDSSYYTAGIKHNLPFGLKIR